MRKIALEMLNSRMNFSKSLSGIVLAILNLISGIMKKENLWSTFEMKRFKYVIKLTKPWDSDSELSSYDSVTAIIVAADKDFYNLKAVIESVYQVMPGCNEITLITSSDPGLHILDLPKNQKIRCLQEDALLNCQALKDLFNTNFPGRENWCLQQMLKFYSILDVKTRYALVVDADTILLHPRAWINKNQKLGLIPTFERESDYGQVLVNLGLIENLPKISFVPHHMFYSVHHFKLMFETLGSPIPIEFASRLSRISDSKSQSPFCIDYEAYGHFMVESFPTDIYFLRWSNLSLSRAKFNTISQSKFKLFFVKLLFNSVSLHSWIEHR